MGYPYSYPSFFTPREPLAVAAKRKPLAVISVAHHALKTQLAVARNKTMRSLSAHNRDIACTWLANRQPGERRIRVGSIGGVRERGWFANGEQAALTTVVEIG